ncbi:MAG: hypothetical protein ABSE05_12115 [Syntrophales bacterium]|jgi:hypothetical protein
MKKILIAAMVVFFVFGTVCAFADDPPADKKDEGIPDAKKSIFDYNCVAALNTFDKSDLQKINDDNMGTDQGADKNTLPP